MRVIVQRVLASRVEIDGVVSGSIGQGLMVLLGITEGDGREHCDFLADKLVHLRIFTDAQEKMNLSLQDIDGEMLIVSQFTLYGDCKKGRRPSFVAAAAAVGVLIIYNISKVANEKRRKRQEEEERLSKLFVSMDEKVEC